MIELIGYARVATRQQSTDRQVVDLLAAGVRRDDLYVDNTFPARASRPDFDRALDALEAGDTLVITALDRLGRSTQNMLAFAEVLPGRGAASACGTWATSTQRRPWVPCSSRSWPHSVRWNTE